VGTDEASGTGYENAHMPPYGRRSLMHLVNRGLDEARVRR
jgi:hypothetical protein